MRSNTLHKLKYSGSSVQIVEKVEVQIRLAISKALVVLLHQIDVFSEVLCMEGILTGVLAEKAIADCTVSFSNETFWTTWQIMT